MANKIGVIFPNETSLADALPNTTAFHSEDGRPLYKDANGNLRDPLGELRVMFGSADIDCGFFTDEGEEGPAIDGGVF